MIRMDGASNMQLIHSPKLYWKKCTVVAAFQNSQEDFLNLE